MHSRQHYPSKPRAAALAGAVGSGTGSDPVRCGTIELTVGQVHYRECGSGGSPPLLLLHPPPRSSLYFVRVMDAWRASGGHRVIALDLPGFGNSCDLPPGISMTGIANVVAQAMTQLNCQRANVFGLHTGNKIAAALAALHPGRVCRLVLAGMTHSIIVDAERRNAAMRAYIERKRPTDPEQDPRAWQDEQADRASSRGYDALYAANYAFDLAAALRRIAVPTLVVELAVPDEDALGRQADALCALLADGRSLQLPFDDRELVLKRPMELVAALQDFFNADLSKPGNARPQRAR